MVSTTEIRIPPFTLRTISATVSSSPTTKVRVGHPKSWPPLPSCTGTVVPAASGMRRTNVVTGALFLAAMFLTPLVSLVPFEAVAPAMVVVGFLMARNVVDIDWQDWGVAVPSFLTFAVMPFTYSIADGIGAGFVSYVFIRLVQGRAKDIHPLMYVVALAFVMFFGVGVIEGWAA